MILSYEDFVNESLRKMYKFTGVIGKKPNPTITYTTGIYYLMMYSLNKRESDLDFLTEFDEYFGAALSMMIQGRARDKFAKDLRKIFSEGNYDWEFEAVEVDGDGNTESKDMKKINKFTNDGWETYYEQTSDFGSENWLYILMNKKFTEEEKKERSKYIKMYIENTDLDEKQIASFYDLMTLTDREKIRHIYLGTKYGI